MDINVVGPCNQLGYGVASLNIVKALMHNGHRVCFFGIPPLEYMQEDEELITQVQNNCLMFNPTAPSLRIYHQHSMALHAGHGLHCGFPIFELTDFTDIELHHLRSLDFIFVTSNWAKDILIEHGFTNVYVAPLGVDRSIFNENVTRHKNDTTVFLNCGKWEIRKGHDVLLQAFNQAFNPDDNVKLIMHCYNPFIAQGNQDWERKYMQSKLGKNGKIRISNNRYSTQYELARLMAQADCGVFPARAEGWNLELLEMMSMGKTVIATNYSAHTEFMTETNSLPINIHALELAEDGIWFHKQGSWAHYGDDQIEQLTHLMQAVHQFKQTQSLGVNVEGIETAKRFSWDATASKIIEGLNYAGRHS